MTVTANGTYLNGTSTALIATAHFNEKKCRLLPDDPEDILNDVLSTKMFESSEMQ